MHTNKNYTTFEMRSDTFSFDNFSLNSSVAPSTVYTNRWDNYEKCHIYILN